MDELTYSEMVQIDEALQSRINKLQLLVGNGHFTETSERQAIRRWLEAAKSAQEKIQHYTKE